MAASGSSILRKALAIVAGIALAIVLIFAVEALSEWLYPLPLDLDSDDPAAMTAILQAMPLPARLLVVIGWFAGTFGGAWLALRISAWQPAAWIITALTIVGGILNLLQFPHPLWMQVAAVAAPLAGGWLASRRHRTPARPLLR